MDSQDNLSYTWIDTDSRNCYGVGVYYNLSIVFIDRYKPKVGLYDMVELDKLKA